MIDDYCDNLVGYTDEEHQERWARVCANCKFTLGKHSASKLFCPLETGIGYRGDSNFVRQSTVMSLSADSKAL